METVLVVCSDADHSQKIMNQLYADGINSIGPVSTAGLALALAGQTQPTVAIVATPPTGRRGSAELADRLLANWGVPSWLMDEDHGEVALAWAPRPEQMERLALALGLSPA